ncbi:hypothetical protein P9B03_01005 [Metasolibacillus meyeri]|uniref:YesK-like protein n=1 Tax=Metasolibacillus meyeri TaxID=1071052 RepID=A0AAW9NQE3_9BACL|nr:hypothetical protein [Metasolibacillus meyeri]MEC1177048.1 hypothetical protein [Metasolibacillus meyeri]
MNLYFFLSIGILIIAVFLYKISQKKSKTLFKYIPAVLFAISIAFVYLKMLFISKRYEAITDIIVLMLLAVGLGSALLTAIIIEMINKRK